MTDLKEKFHKIFSTLATKNFWLFFGSALIVSVAYMDPGNWGTSISAGALFNYELLWIIWVSSGMAMLFQYLSGKIGIAGYSLAGLVNQRWKNKTLIFIYWILSEIAVLATDLAEFLGIAVALNLLFGIPLIIGSLIAIADVLLLLYLGNKSFRRVEYAFILFVSIVGLGYVYELFITKPDINKILESSVTPNISSENIFFIVGIVGATIMPHALFVHSWLIKNKMQEYKNKFDKKTALSYHLLDNSFSLLIAGLINAAILIMSASAFYNSGFLVLSLEEAYHTLTPLFGNIASIVFAVTLLAASISSSITGVLAGQCIMESLTNFKISAFLRRIITRVINVIPLFVVLSLEIEPIQILVLTQVILSFLLPVPLLPLIYYSSNKEVMGSLVNKKITTFLALIFTILILALNGYLLYDFF